MNYFDLYLNYFYDILNILEKILLFPHPNHEINYLNTDDFTEEDNNNLMASDEFFSSGYGTPILLYIKNNSIIDKVDGLTNSDGYIEFLRTNGFIK